MKALFPSPAVLILAIAFFTGIGQIRDFDIWWHLAAGREIVETGVIPRVDSWSHTAAGKPWFAHEWLAEIVFWAIWSAAGANGILVWKALMGLATLATLSALYRLSDPERGLGHLTALISAAVCVHYHLLERPHLYTNLLLALQVLLLERWRRTGDDRLGWLPPLYLLWANLHGGVIIGLATFGLYFAGLLAEAVAGDAGATRRAKRLAAVGALCLAVSLINPRGFDLVTYPLKYTGHGTLAGEITEWTSPDFREYRPMEGLMLALLVLLLAARQKPFGATETLLALAGLHLFLQSKRSIVFLALFVLPAAAERLALFAGQDGRDQERSDGRPTALARSEATPSLCSWLGLAGRAFRRLSRGIARASARSSGWAALAIFAGLVSWRAIANEPPRISRAYYPDGAVEYLEKHRLEGRMLNEFVYGGYFVWKLFPHYSVFIDSRTDLFFDEYVFQEYLAVFKLAMGWKEVLDKRKVDWAVFERGHPLGTVLEATGDWPEVYADDLSSIRVKRRAAGS